MKNGMLLILLLVSGFNLFGQDHDSIPQTGFSFTIGTKVTIQLIPVDSVNFDYRILKFEPYHETIDLDNDEKLLSDKIDNDKIEFVFSYGKYGKNKKEKDNDLRIVLILKSGLNSIIDYKADIQVPNKEFESTSVVELLPDVKTREFWPYQIDVIALHNFQKRKLNTYHKNE